MPEPPLILIPPSEGKAPGGSGPAWAPSTMAIDLDDRRLAVMAALRSAMRRNEAQRQKLLGVKGDALAAATAANRTVAESPTMAAAQRFTGVLYDALDRDSLDAAGRRRANRWIVISSALYGALRPGDPIAPYRLSMAVNLPDVGSLASFWRPLLAPVLAPASGRGIVVDARSGTYAASWPVPAELASRWVEVKVVGATHMAKHARGLVTRAICAAGIDPRRPGGLVEPLGAAMGPDFALSLEEPRRAGAPWTLSVTPPAGPVSGHRITL